MKWISADEDGELLGWQAPEPWDAYIVEEMQRCPAGGGGPCPWLAIVRTGDMTAWTIQHGGLRALDRDREERFDAWLQHGPPEESYEIAQEVLEGRARNERGGVTSWQEALGAAMLLFLQDRHAAIRALNGGQPWGGRTS